MEKFNYEEAFSRNLGWLTKEEQDKIKTFTIAVPGLGGVGGHHLHALIRMGFSNFHISDLDYFELGNFNRQFGSYISTIGRDKAECLKEILLDINPDSNIKVFNKGINEENMEEFLEGVDLVADGLDLYASHLRAPLYELAYKKGIFVVTSGPFGMGTSVMAFHPNKMSFNKYFDLERDNLTVESQIIRFLVGLSPNMLHRKYIASPEHVQLFNGKLPSLHVGCYAASAAMGSTIMKIALGRGKVIYAPRGYQVDFYLNKVVKFWRPFGNKNPLQRILIKGAHRMFKTKEFN